MPASGIVITEDPLPVFDGSEIYPATVHIVVESDEEPAIYLYPEANCIEPSAQVPYLRFGKEELLQLIEPSLKLSGVHLVP